LILYVAAIVLGVAAGKKSSTEKGDLYRFTLKFWVFLGANTLSLIGLWCYANAHNVYNKS